MPHKVICLSPWLDLSLSLLDKKAGDPILNEPVLKRARHMYVSKGESLSHPLISPYFYDFPLATQLLIHVGEREILRPQIVSYVDRLVHKKALVQFKLWPGETHVFHLKERYNRHAKMALKEIASFIQNPI